MSDQKLAAPGYTWKKLGSLPMPNLPGVVAAPAETTVGEAPAQQAYEEGFSQGYAEGQAQAQAEQQALSNQLQQLLEETQRLRQRSAEEGLQDIAIAMHAIFKTLFHYELRTSDGLIKAMAAEVTQTLNTERHPDLFLNRGDHQQLDAVLSDDLKTYIKVDDALPSGVIRASAGKSMLELDVVANLEQILTAAIATSAIDPDHERTD